MGEDNRQRAVDRNRRLPESAFQQRPDSINGAPSRYEYQTVSRALREVLAPPSRGFFISTLPQPLFEAVRFRPLISNLKNRFLILTARKFGSPRRSGSQIAQGFDPPSPLCLLAVRPDVLAKH